ncbi:serine protease [Bdellovibrio bacteriovorus]|uniref:trypsin-like serine peptidase n=1 Tax=Bdellovibrio bacteriovorus TaxID=959 RepID=UPI0035A8EB12
MNKYLLLLLPFLLLACGEQRTSTSEVEMKQSTGVLYGDDTREDLYENGSYANIASATAILVEGRKMTQKGDLWSVDSQALDKHYPLCPDEKFVKQQALGLCSGVLIAPNKVLTAGHCMQSKERCAGTKFMFGWNLQKSLTKTVRDADVYHCKNVIEQKTHRAKGIDYAIVELDRDVENVTPVKIAEEKTLGRGEEVVSLSYPLGIPLKKDIGKVAEYSPEKNLFKVEVDTFAGSSGSPLFNTNNELIGILSTGMEDFLEDDIFRIQTEGGCLNIHRCKNGQCFGESFFKASLIDL